MPKRVFTFGYEGLSIERFIARLQDVGVQHVVDVRAMPLSRKRGFSKTAFRSELAAAGLGYTHAVAMGCPKPVRDRYKIDGNWRVYTSGFLKYLDGQEGELCRVTALTQEQPSCLVCFEADHNYCHRLYVARAISARNGSSIVHLNDRTVIPEPAVSIAA